jgi:glycosyltransferase involved in cell wall biosynthesis
LDYDGEFVISYIGGFSPQRGIETIIRSMPEIARRIPEVKLLLVGSGTDSYVASLRKLCSRLGVEEYIEFTGWVDFELIPSYYTISDLTLIPYYTSEASKYALPNKLFQSMAFRTPVVASELPTLRRILTQTGAGRTFDSESALAETVAELYEAPQTRDEMGDRGREAVEDKYNINHEIEHLLTLLNRLPVHA